MPPQPRWYANLPRIRRVLEGIDLKEHPTLDRSAIQELFGVKTRQANNLMRTLKGRIHRNGAEVSVEDLLKEIDKMAAPGGIAAAEIQLKIRAAARVTKLQQQIKPKRIPPPPPKPPGAALPFGVSQFAPGQVLVSYSTPEELLSRVAGFAEEARKDFASFAEGLTYPQPVNDDLAPGDAASSTSHPPLPTEPTL